MKCKDKKCLNELPSYETKVTFCTECRRRFGEYMRASNDKLLARDGGHHRDIYTFGKFKDQSGNYEN